MKTSCHGKFNDIDRRKYGRICISVQYPRWIPPKAMPWAKNLAPTYRMLRMSKESYLILFDEILSGQDPQKVWEDLHAMVPYREPVLMCFCNTPLTESNWCHRQLVAAWFEKHLDVTVSELVVPGENLSLFELPEE